MFGLIMVSYKIIEVLLSLVHCELKKDVAQVEILFCRNCLEAEAYA